MNFGNIPDYNQLAGKKVQRIEALSDGVFAIAMTLLVLDLRVPVNEAMHGEGELYSQLYNILPRLLSYFMSFMTLGIFWTGHSTQFSFIDKSDRNLNWITIFFLMFISLLPFTTAFLSEHINFKISIAIYWLNIFMAGVLILAHWKYAYKHNFISASVINKEAIDKAISHRVYTAQTLYAIAALFCFINNYVSIILIIAIQLNYAIAFNFRRKKL